MTSEVPLPTESILQPVNLDAVHTLELGQLPDALVPSNAEFNALWEAHPAEPHLIHIHGRRVRTPRWQQAYGADYHFSGQTYEAVATPSCLQPLVAWAQNAIHPQLNGVLVNWYDGSLGHYIGKHRDSIVNMVEGSPIVTISFGEERIFRMRPYRQSGFRDFPAAHGSVIVIPWATNRAWTHEVPAAVRFRDRRISVTLRAFRT